MTKIGIFGGTFNPPHKGHIKIASSFSELLQLDQLLFVPAASPVHKVSNDLVSAQDRLQMCSLCTSVNPVFSVSDFEVNNKVKSYTIFTIREFQKRFAGAKLFLIIGSDMLFTLNEWFLYKEILKSVTICAAARNPEDQEHLETHKKKYESMGAEIIIAEMKPLSVSSTEIRQRLKRGMDVSEFVLPEVYDYIKARGLYQS